MTFAAGDLIGGRYRLDELIGTGGMGQVFRGVDTVLARPVAIKLVDAVESRRREEIMQGFLREARISAAIDHRNVVRILDFGTHGSTVPYMVMELLEGESVADILGRGDAMPFDWLLAIVTQVLDGLAAAHDAGIVHRDLKPENIFLVRDQGQVSPKILDFGISKFLDSNGTAQVTTKHGHVVGTPAYMSPEQARGIRQIDQRSDIYSVGVVLYELLCGEMPFYSENPGDLMMMIMTSPERPLVERVPDVGVALSEVVARAMNKRPEDRYQSVREMQKAVLAASQEVLGSAAVARLNARLRPSSWRTSEHQQLETHSEAPPPRRRSIAATELTHRGEKASPAPKAKRWMLPAMGAGLVACAIGLGAIWFGRTAADPAPRFIVVRSEPATAPTAAMAQTPVTTPLSPSPESRAKNSESATAKVKLVSTPGAPKSTAEILAESFRKQRSPVVTCLNAHAAEAEAVPKLAVKFALSKEGHVDRASVSPADLSQTPMGSCIEAAVRAMSFPAQAAPISFEVPLTARKGG